MAEEKKGELLPIGEVLGHKGFSGTSYGERSQIFEDYVNESDADSFRKIANHRSFASLPALRRNKILSLADKRGFLQQLRTPPPEESVAAEPPPISTAEASLRERFPQSTLAQLPEGQGIQTVQDVVDIPVTLAASAARVAVNIVKDLTVGTRNYLATVLDKLNVDREGFDHFANLSPADFLKLTPGLGTALAGARSLGKDQDVGAQQLEETLTQLTKDITENAPDLLKELDEGFFRPAEKGEEGFSLPGVKQKVTWVDKHTGLKVVKAITDSAVYYLPMRGASTLFGGLTRRLPLLRHAPRLNKFVAFGGGGGAVIAAGTGGDAAEIATQMAGEYTKPDGSPLFTPEQTAELARQARFRGTTFMMPVAFLTSGIGIGLASGAGKSWVTSFMRGYLGDAAFEGAEEVIDMFISNAVNGRVAPSLALWDAFLTGVAGAGGQGGLNAMTEFGINIKQMRQDNTLPPTDAPEEEPTQEPGPKNTRLHTLDLDPETFVGVTLGAPVEFADSTTGETLSGIVVNKTPDGKVTIETELKVDEGGEDIEGIAEITEEAPAQQELPLEPEPEVPAEEAFITEEPGEAGQLEFDFQSAPEVEQAAEEGVPFMVTERMRQGLQGLGYTDADLRNMTPKEAHALLDSETTRETLFGPAETGPEIAPLPTERQRGREPDTREAPSIEEEFAREEAPTVEERPTEELAPARVAALPIPAPAEPEPTALPAPAPEAVAPPTPAPIPVEEPEPQVDIQQERVNKINNVMRTSSGEEKRAITRRALQIRKDNPELTQLDAIEQAIPEVIAPPLEPEIVEPTPEVPPIEEEVAPPEQTLKEKVEARRQVKAAQPERAIVKAEPTLDITDAVPIPPPTPTLPTVPLDIERAVQAIQEAQANPAYDAFIKGVQNATEDRYGDPFPAFAAITEQEMDAWADGRNPPLLFTSIPEVARTEQEVSVGEKVVFSVEAPVASILLAGRQEQAEVVLDTAQLPFEDATLVPFEEVAPEKQFVGRPEDELTPERILELRAKIEAREALEVDRPEVSAGPAPAERLAETEAATEERRAEEREAERQERLRAQQEFMERQGITPQPPEVAPERREVGGAEGIAVAAVAPTVEAAPESRAVKRKEAAAQARISQDKKSVDKASANVFKVMLGDSAPSWITDTGEQILENSKLDLDMVQFLAKEPLSEAAKWDGFQNMLEALSEEAIQYMFTLKKPKQVEQEFRVALTATGLSTLIDKGQNPLGILHGAMLDYILENVNTQEFSAAEMDIGTAATKLTDLAAGKGLAFRKFIKPLLDFKYGEVKKQVHLELSKLTKPLQNQELEEPSHLQDETKAFKRPTNINSLPFQLWFKGSKVVTSDLKPRVVFHATAADTPFSTFAHGDIGFHFGNTKQANARLYHGEVVEGKDQNAPRVLPVYLNIQNPIYFRGDVGAFDAPAVVAQALERQGIIDQAEFEDISEVILRDTLGKSPYNSRSFEYIRSLLESKGYDGIFYPNTVEGEGLSFIAFRPQQVKSAIGNTGKYRWSDKDILKSAIRDDLPDDLNWLPTSHAVGEGDRRIVSQMIVEGPVKIKRVERAGPHVTDLEVIDNTRDDFAAQYFSDLTFSRLGKNVALIEVGRMLYDELGNPISGNGIYRPGRGVIGIAMKMLMRDGRTVQDMKTTLAHEHMHAARDLIFTRQENRILESKFAPGSAASKALQKSMNEQEGEHFEKGENNQQSQLHNVEERIAHGASYYWQGEVNFDTTTNKLLKKLADFWERLTNWFTHGVMGKEMGAFNRKTGTFRDKTPQGMKEFFNNFREVAFTERGRSGFTTATEIIDAFMNGEMMDRVGRKIEGEIREDAEDPSVSVSVENLYLHQEQARMSIEEIGREKTSRLRAMFHNALADYFGGSIPPEKDYESLIQRTLMRGDTPNLEGMRETLDRWISILAYKLVKDSPAHQEFTQKEYADILFDLATAPVKDTAKIEDFVLRGFDAIETATSADQAELMTDILNTYVQYMGDYAAFTDFAGLPEGQASIRALGALKQAARLSVGKVPPAPSPFRILSEEEAKERGLFPTGKTKVVKAEDSNFVRDRELSEVDGSDDAAFEKFMVGTGLRDIDSSEGVKALMKKVRLRISPTTPFTEEEAHRMASGSGMTDKTIARLHVAGPHELEKAQKVLTAAVTDVHKVIKPIFERHKHRMRPGVELDITKDMTPEEVVKWDRARLRAQLLFAVLDKNGGIATQAGRLLQAHKKFVGTREALREELDEMLGLREGRIAISRAMLRLEQLRDARELGEYHKFNNKINRATTADKLVELWYMSVLSHPLTWMRNMVGAGAFIGTSPFERILGASAGRVLGVMTESNRKDHLDVREAKSQLVGMVNAQKIGLALAWETFKTDSPTDPATKLQLHAGRAMGDFFPVKVLRKISTTMLMASDEYLKSVAFFGEAYALIDRQARVVEKLNGEALDERIEDLRELVHGWRAAASEATQRKLDEALSDNEVDFLIQRGLEEFSGKPVSQKELDIIQGIYTSSLKESRWRTLTAKGGVLAEIGPKLIAASPPEVQPYARLMVALGIPFLRLTLESVKRVLPRTPIGLPALVSPKGYGKFLPKEVSEQLLRGGAAADQARGKIILGNMIFGAALWAALQGFITPSCGTLSRGRAGALQAGGAKCSAMWDPVSESYIDISGFEPVTKIMTIAADVVELASRKDKLPEDLPGEIFGMVGEALSVQTFKGVPTLYKALAESRDRPLTSLAENTIVGFIPNALRLPDEFLSPYKRAQTGLLEKLQRKVPIFASALPKDVTALGDDILHSFYSQKLPRHLREALIDPTSKRYRQIKLPKAGRKLKSSPDRPGSKRGVMVELNAEQWTMYQRLSGKHMKRWLNRYVRSSSWRRLPIKELQERVNKELSSARTKAASRVRSKFRKDFRVAEREARKK